MNDKPTMVTPPVRDARTMPLDGQNALLASFSAIAEALTSSGDLATVLQCIAEESLHLLHATSARVRMPDARGTQLRLAALADDAKATIRLPPPDAISYLRANSIAGKAFQTNQISVAHGAPRRGVPEEQYALYCTVPLTTRSRTLGVLTIWRANEEPFSEDEVAVMRIFGNAAALAIEQVRLLTEERDRRRRMETLTEVARIISAATERDALYEAVYAQCVRLFGVEHFYIARTTPDDQLAPVLWYSYAHRQREQESVLLPPGLGQCVVQDNLPINTADASAEYRRRGLPAPQAGQWGERVHTYDMPWMGVPIREGKRATGVIATNGRATPYTDEECAVLFAIADQVGVAMRNIDLLEAQRARATRMATLADVSHAISAVTDHDALYDVVYRECSRLLPMANSRICRIVPESGEVFAECYFRHGARVRELEGRVLHGGLSPVIRDTGQPMMTNDYAAELVKRGMALVNTPLPPPNSSWLGVPVIQGDEVYGIISLNTTERRLTTEDRDTLLAVANQVGIAMANARLLARERTRAERLAILNDISRTISAVLDLEPLLSAIARECMRLVDLDYPLIGYRAVTGGWITATGVTGAIEHHERDPGVGPLATVVIASRKPLFVTDYETACQERGLAPVALPGLVLPLGWIGAPMVVGAQVVGVLAGFIPAEHATAENAQLLSIMANQAAIAIENARLYHDAQELSVVEERNRLAREIHDTIAQGLTATTYQLELADTFLAMEPPKPDLAREKLHRSLALTRANLEEARRSVMDLRAAHLRNATLTEALERLATTFTNDAGVVVTVAAAEEFPTLPLSVSAGLYRIGQEALTNIAKHARATRVAMTLSIEEGCALLTIHDDGVGFDPEIIATHRTARGTSGGFGLIGIRERAQLLGGTSDIRSDVGAGTQIVVRVPIKL